MTDDARHMRRNLLIAIVGALVGVIGGGVAGHLEANSELEKTIGIQAAEHPDIDSGLVRTSRALSAAVAAAAQKVNAGKEACRQHVTLRSAFLDWAVASRERGPRDYVEHPVDSLKMAIVMDAQTALNVVRSACHHLAFDSVELAESSRSLTEDAARLPEALIQAETARKEAAVHE